MMKNLKFKILVVILLSLVALLLFYQNRPDTLRAEISGFAVDDTASVSRIFLADMAGNSVLLSKVEPGYWTLNDSLDARIESVNMLLSSMFRMTVQAPVSRASYNNVITNLAANSVKVEVYKIKPRINLFNVVKLFPREKLTKTYYVGKPTSDHLGTYMLMEGSDTPFIVFLPGLRGFLSARFSAKPNDWRDHTIFAKNPHEISSIQVDFPHKPDESFIVEKFGRNELKVRSLQSGSGVAYFDTTKMINFINAYRNIRYESMVDTDAPINRDSIMQSMPLHVITVTDTAGYVQRVSTFKRKNFGLLMYDEDEPFEFDPDRLYALINDGKEMVLIQYFVFDPVTRPLSFFTQ
jgi:hypothetical protein